MSYLVVVVVVVEVGLPNGDRTKKKKVLMWKKPSQDPRAEYSLTLTCNVGASSEK